MSQCTAGIPDPSPMAEFAFVVARFIQAAECKRQHQQCAKPANRPRPIPIDVGDVDEGWDFMWLLDRNSLYRHLEANEAWICLSCRTTAEIYTGLFRKVDPEGEFREKCMNALNETLWGYGFRTIEGKSKGTNHAWVLPEDIRQPSPL